MLHEYTIIHNIIDNNGLARGKGQITDSYAQSFISQLYGYNYL